MIAPLLTPATSISARQRCALLEGLRPAARGAPGEISVKRVSVNEDGSEIKNFWAEEGDSWGTGISPDGSFVFWTSNGIDIFSGDLNGNFPDVLITQTSTLATCGDGIPELGEGCDDGNTDNLDGCTNLCEIDNDQDGWANDIDNCPDA